MHWLDYVVFITMMLATTVVGFYYVYTGRKQKESVLKYFTGNRQLVIIPTAFSIFSSSISAITLIGTPVEIYTSGIKWSAYGVGASMGSVLAAVTFVPLLYRLKLLSVYKYLEMRYNSVALRRLTMVLQSFNGIAYAGVAVFTPCLILEGATGIPVIWSTIATCLLTCFYATTGGVRAVVWVDMSQSIIMFLGMIVITGISISSVNGGLAEAWSIAQQTGRDNFFDTNTDINGSYSLWMLLLYGTYKYFIWMGINQEIVQRISGLPSERAAQWAILLMAPQAIFMNVIMGTLAICIFAHYYQLGCDPVAGKLVARADHIILYFVSDYIRVPGVLGILLATVFSGAISTLSTVYNAQAAVLWSELSPIMSTATKERFTGAWLKLFTIIVGLATLCSALLATLLHGSIITLTMSVLGLTSSSILGTFLCASCIPFTTAKGNIISQFVGLSFSSILIGGQQMFRLGKTIILPSNISTCSNLTYTGLPSEDTIENSTQIYSAGSISNANLPTTELPAWLESVFSLHYSLIPVLGMLATLFTAIVLSPVFGCGKGTNKGRNLFMHPCSKPPIHSNNTDLLADEKEDLMLE